MQAKDEATSSPDATDAHAAAAAATEPDVTAAVLVIGDEILSGRTKDQNIGYIAEYLTGIGISVREARIVADDEAEIVAALNAVRARYTYVFTTGGIGPTHDDITADCVAKAFGVGIDHHPRAVELLREHLGADRLNEARLRMARIPDGAELVDNPVSKAPGFMIGNVIVMAGIPRIMQAMLDGVAKRLRTGRRVHARAIRVEQPEGDVAQGLGQMQKAYPDVQMGSYPFFDKNGPGTHVVLRSPDEARLDAALAALLEAFRDSGFERFYLVDEAP